MSDDVRTEREFLNSIAQSAAAGDLVGWQCNRSVYADWLEDQGRPFDAEEVRERLARPMSPHSDWPPPHDIEGVTPHQRGVLGQCLTRPFAILSGTPGTGKTTCSAAILRALTRRHPAPRVAVAAPTGKAAVRCTQAMRQQGVSVTATTIHRLLGYNGSGWERTARNPIPARFVVIDEASMLDTSLAARLLDACRDGTHVLLVGDVGQLPPVGHGCPLRDLMAAGLPLGQLTEIRRNAGMIVHACAAIRRREHFDLAPAYREAAGENLVHVEAKSAEQVLEKLAALYARIRDRGRFDLFDEVQVIAPLNTRGAVSRVALNVLLQSMLNPKADDRPEFAGYRLGDKIICLRNQNVTRNGGPGLAPAPAVLANGELGRVTAADQTNKVVAARFPDPQRDYTLAYYTEEERQRSEADFALAYAVTGHKSQGSEWPVVIAIVDDSAGACRLCGREYWYTVLSRARQLCITVGREAVLRQQAKRLGLEKRKTFLAEQLTGVSSL